jgi:hypothetical protein
MKGKLTIRLLPREAAMLRAEAERTDKSMNDIVQRALREHFERADAPPDQGFATRLRAWIDNFEPAEKPLLLFLPHGGGIFHDCGWDAYWTVPGNHGLG